MSQTKIIKIMQFMSVPKYVDTQTNGAIIIGPN